MSDLKVRLVKGKVVEKSSDWNNEELKSSDPEIKLLAVKSTIKVDLTRLLQPVLSETSMNTYKVCDDIISNLGLDENMLTRMKQSILRAMIFNEVHRICIQASSITSKDYANYLNSQDIIDDIAEKVLILFNK